MSRQTITPQATWRAAGPVVAQRFDFQGILLARHWSRRPRKVALVVVGWKERSRDISRKRRNDNAGELMAGAGRVCRPMPDVIQRTLRVEESFICGATLLCANGELRLAIQ